MVARTLLVELDHLDEGFFGRPARDLTVAEEVVHHLARFRLTRLDAERLQEVVERLFPVPRRETELRQQEQLDERVRDAPDDLAKVLRRFLTALQGGEQARQLRAAAEILGVEADGLAQRRDRAFGNVRIVSGPQAAEVHGAERPVSRRGIRIALHRLGGGRFRALQITGREAQVGDGDERLDRLEVEFGGPPVGGDRFVAAAGHLRQAALAEHPVGLGDRIHGDRIFRFLRGFGFRRSFFGGNRLLGAVRLPGERQEKRQQSPTGHPRHGPGIYRRHHPQRRPVLPVGTSDRYTRCTSLTPITLATRMAWSAGL